MSPEKISLYPSRSIKSLGCFVMACFCSTGKHLIRQRHNNDPSGSTIVPLTVARPYSELFATRHLLSYHPGSPQSISFASTPKVFNVPACSPSFQKTLPSTPPKTKADAQFNLCRDFSKVESLVIDKDVEEVQTLISLGGKWIGLSCLSVGGAKLVTE